MGERELFIVQVDAFQGEHLNIEVSDAEGRPVSAVYCVACRNDGTGVLEFVDYGYDSVAEVRAAWPKLP